jgi:hypothetical protein
MGTLPRNLLALGIIALMMLGFIATDAPWWIYVPTFGFGVPILFRRLVDRP